MQGDLNQVQIDALIYLMGSNNKESAEIEKEKVKMNIFANNPSLYKTLFEDREVYDDIDWIQPESEEEALDLFAELDKLHVETEVLEDNNG